MVTLRLFHVADPFRPIESRVLSSAEMAVGRDPAADWPISDSACELSRRHCSLRLAEEGVYIRDTSANGVFLGAERRRLPRDAETLLKPEEVIHFGQFMITMDTTLTPANDCKPEADANTPIDAPFHAPMLREPTLSAADFQVRNAWTTAAPQAERKALPDAALLEAFCDGAGIDPSLLAGEDPAQVLRRAGAVYQQAVLGLTDLMSERTSTKSAYRMERTRVSAANNNPFKWAEAHRVGVDLLRSGEGPFLAGAAAINESFQDLKKHLLCLVAGSRAAVAAAFEEVSPRQAEEAVKGQSLIFQTKVEACWRELQRRHARALADAHDNADSVINRAFKGGYERHLRKLDGLGTLS